MVARGDIYWVPWPLIVYYGSEKDRPCVVAALEPTADGLVAHLVPGTTKRARGPALVIDVGETQLPRRTEFDFSTSFPLPTEQLVSAGKNQGALPPTRLSQLDAVIRASGRTALLRLVDA